MMTATLSMGGVVGSATPAASAWVKSADPWPTRISVLRPALGRAGPEHLLCPWVCSALARRARRWGHGHPAARSPIRLRASCCYHLSGQGWPRPGTGVWVQRPPQGLLLGSGKGPELALRTGGRLAGSELGLRCLLGAQVPSQA